MAPTVCIISRPDLVPTVHGAAVKIIRTAEALSRLGARVFIVTNDRLWFYEARDGLVNRRRYPQALLSVTNTPPAIKERLARLHIPSYWNGIATILQQLGYPTDEHFLYQPMVDLDFWLRVLYVGWAHRVQVYQAEFPGYAVPAVLAARLLGGQSALVQHNVEHRRLKDTTELPPPVLSRIRTIEAACMKAVDHVIAVSEPDRQLMLADGVPDERIVVIPHGVDLPAYRGLDRVACRARITKLYQLPTQTPLLVFHGTLHYWPNTMAVKHIAEDLLPRLAARGISVKVLICGMNPPRYYAHPDIVFTDVVQDLPEHLAAADLAIVPLDDGGGTRLKILEYFAAGLPVISTPKGAEGIPAADGQALVLASDMDAFADAIVRLLQNPALAEVIAAGGHHFVQAYDWDALCTLYLKRFGLPVLEKPAKVDAAVDASATASAIAPARGTATATATATASATATATATATASAAHAGAQAQPAAPIALTPDAAHLSPMQLKVSSHVPAPITPTKPLTMIMMINRGCNLRCDFCDLYEDPERMPLELALQIIDDAAEMGVKTVVFTGGEPFLHAGLWEMIRRATDLGMGTNVTTNGTLIDRHLDKILDSGLASVSVSVDGLKETHEALRKIKGCHDKTLQGIDLLRDKGIHTNLYFVVTGVNVLELPAVYQLAQEKGCGFDFWPVNDAHHLYLLTPEHRQDYRQVIDTLAKVDPSVAAKRDYYYAGLDYHAGWDKRVRCLGLIEQFGVNLKGELVPCCVWDNTDLTVGSLRESSLPTLFFGPEARARREQIFHEGCHNRCFNHSLYEFQLSTGLSFVVGEGAIGGV